ncbi:hypothetical protein [Kutzneria kofuensis]|uniref:Uncharacterized protein n=1 Tax=Kutzneria kofuensis TaxID=103725 RepID=A0A7W9KNZ0_9PSEU|nr:hypothetical protein [Kutzneria kofuensis]MBB5896056.1 hypothetical protein [Kutzneria kofuensis]
MAAVLVDGAVLLCTHGGKGAVVPSQTVLKVGGKPALLKSDKVGPDGFAGCTNQKPCQSIQQYAAGLSTVLSVHGTPVVLSSAKGATDQDTFRVLSAGQTALDSK